MSKLDIKKRARHSTGSSSCSEVLTPLEKRIFLITSLDKMDSQISVGDIEETPVTEIGCISPTS